MRTLRVMKQAQSKTMLPASELNQVTMQELSNFLLALKSVVEPIKRYAKGTAGPIKVVDEEIHLASHSRQMVADAASGNLSSRPLKLKCVNQNNRTVILPEFCGSECATDRQSLSRVGVRLWVSVGQCAS